jgi:hypothetical protein
MFGRTSYNNQVFQLDGGDKQDSESRQKLSATDATT